jgi:hypothetical protein
MQLGHANLESTVRYLRIEVNDVLEIGSKRRRSAPGRSRGETLTGHKQSAGTAHSLSRKRTVDGGYAQALSHIYILMTLPSTICTGYDATPKPRRIIV